MRNPFDRVVSYYYGGAIQSGLSFKEWVLDRYRDENYKDYIRMYSDFTHWFDKDEIDYVLKFENLDDDFGKLKESLSIPNLIEVQKNSYKELTEFNAEAAELTKGFDRVFKSISQLKI